MNYAVLLVQISSKGINGPL